MTLEEAVAAVLTAWDDPGEDRLEAAMADLHKAYNAVEVTMTGKTLADHPNVTPMRRSGARNVSEPHLQNAFIDEARNAMGQPTLADCQALVGKEVIITFNVDWHPARGVLTEVVDHSHYAYLILDNYKERLYPLNSIQEIQTP